MEKETRKITSILELTGALNYLVSVGKVVANNKNYIDVVNIAKKAGEPITVKMTTTESKKLYAGDIKLPADEKVVEEYHIAVPVMINLGINGLGKTAYKLTTEESRTFKLPIAEQFCLTESDYKSVLGKTKVLEGSDKPLPTTPAIEDFNWISIEGNAKFVHSSKTSKSEVRSKLGDKSDSTKPLISAKELADRVSKAGSSDNKLARPVKLKIDKNRLEETVDGYIIKIAEESTGLGYFSHIYFDNKGGKNYLSLEKNEDKFNIILQKPLLAITQKNVVKIIASGEYTGQSIHDLKDKDKKSILVGIKNYKVYANIGK